MRFKVDSFHLTRATPLRGDKNRPRCAPGRLLLQLGV
jgi:hypothetical protein